MKKLLLVKSKFKEWNKVLLSQRRGRRIFLHELLIKKKKRIFLHELLIANEILDEKKMLERGRVVCNIGFKKAYDHVD